MRKEEIIRALRRILGQESFRKNDEMIFFCKNPYGCNGEHHKPKLSVNIETHSHNCWVCGWRGSSLKGILKLGSVDTLRAYVGEQKQHGCNEEEKGFDMPILPDCFRSLTANIFSPYLADAVQYCLNRGLTESDFLKYKLGYCETGEYRHRIIIPSFNSDGELNFFVGRKYYDYVGLSYKHGIFDKDIIFNEYLIDWNKPIILVEGPFDSIIAGDNAIPLQGSNFKEESKLFNKIIKSRVPVYLALDVDARGKQLKYAKLLCGYGVDVYHIALEREGVNDVADLRSKERFSLAKQSAIPVGSKIDLLRIRATA